MAGICTLATATPPSVQWLRRSGQRLCQHPRPPGGEFIRPLIRLCVPEFPRGDKGGNVLTGKVLAQLPPHDRPKVVYDQGCRLGAARLKIQSMVYKQVAYVVKVS